MWCACTCPWKKRSSRELEDAYSTTTISLWYSVQAALWIDMAHWLIPRFWKKGTFPVTHVPMPDVQQYTQLYSRKTLLISHSVRIVKHIAGVINKSISSRALCKLTLTLTKKSFKRQMHWISDPTRGSPLFFSLYEKIGWVPCKKGELWGVEHTIHLWTYKCICQYTFRVELFSVMKWPAVVPLRYESFLHFPFMRTFVGGSLPQTWNPPL